MFTRYYLGVGWILLNLLSGYGEPIRINRVDQILNPPLPYLMRDWYHVAQAYDSLVFDVNRQGQYLPLVEIRPQGQNYPQDPAFGLHTVVGTPYPQSGEAINALPAVIGASLVGIDKTSQYGMNWVKMCKDYFNRRPEENIYLNHPVAASGSDWWYDTMPNIFFMQLMALYPSTEEFATQRDLLAGQWLKAVQAMGGTDAPWKPAKMYYRAWRMSDMTPTISDVPEPESAGAIAWILYQAYTMTGNRSYRVGAELAMEYLNSLNFNPAYELQLSYGVYIAARMNAELGTGYNLEKMVNWCFDQGYLRNWGMIVGRWGGYDCHGLIGEISANDYAFCMNTFEQIGALVPAVRYQDGLAQAIGKWVLHAANNARLFYRAYLPDANQDSETWSRQFDTTSCLAYEALRKNEQGQSPFATGDAIRGGWGATNLALYGSSHVGILGGIICTTNVEMILKLDLLRTDYYHAPAYPSWLIYNPHTETKIVTVPIDNQPVDIYDAVINQFLFQNVTDSVFLSIEPEQACLLVIAPAGGTISYHHNQMMINGVVVDYSAYDKSLLPPLRIKSLAAPDTAVYSSDSILIYCTLGGERPNSVSYQWQCDGGQIYTRDSIAVWIAPDQPGQYRIGLRIQQDEGSGIEDSLILRVLPPMQHPPHIDSMRSESRKIQPGFSTEIQCFASDTEEDTLTYIWEAGTGMITGRGSKIAWQSPDSEGICTIRCRVVDSDSLWGRDSLTILVRRFQLYPSGKLLVYYPMTGNFQDESGNGHHGIATQIQLCPDHWGVPASAALFNGYSSSIRVPNHSELNTSSAITIALWIRIDSLYARESYPISHGNWENRWKISLTDRRIRWTIKTDAAGNAGIRDLDSRYPLQPGRYFHLVVMYDGAWLEIYLDGQLDNFVPWSGRLMPTVHDMMLGQVLPQNSSYNFKGVLDDVMIWDYPLSPEDISRLYQSQTEIGSSSRGEIASGLLFRIYPNPFRDKLTIVYVLADNQPIDLTIFNLNGERVRRLEKPDSGGDGIRRMVWDGRDDAGRTLSSGIYLLNLKNGDYHQTQKILLLK